MLPNGFCWKCRAASDHPEGQLTWSSQHNSCKKNAASSNSLSTWPSSTWQRPLTPCCMNCLGKPLLHMDALSDSSEFFNFCLVATVLTNSGHSEPFLVKSGVKQCCVIVPTLFAIFIAAFLHLVNDDLPLGIEIVYRMDGKLFNLSQLISKTEKKNENHISGQIAVHRHQQCLISESLWRTSPTDSDRLW